MGFRLLKRHLVEIVFRENFKIENSLARDEHCILDYSMVELKDNAYITALKDDVLRYNG